MEFTVQDITSLHVSISFDGVKHETLRDKLALIERGQFISGTVTSDTFLQFADKHIPLLRLAGNGFKISIYRDLIELIISPQIENIPGVLLSKTNISHEELFAKNNLQKINVDFNAIVGHVLGRLGIAYDATKFTFSLNLGNPNTHYHENMFDKVTIPALQSLVGESTKIQSINPEFKTREVFLDIQADVYYNLHTQKPPHRSKTDAVIFSGLINFENTGVQDLNLLLDTYLKRINDMVEKLMGGLKANER